MAKKRKPRRRITLVLGILVGLFIYGLAVDRTGVSLDEITSENRQNQLVRIIRSLAHPELVTYDFELVNTDIDFQIPCIDGPSPATAGGVTVSSTCGDPGDVIEISGTGFAAFAEGRLQFIPDSEFNVSLPLGLFEADSNGDFTEDIEVPQRISEIPQTLRVQVPNRLGTWSDREEVWTDTNKNGARDLGVIGTGGLEVVVDNASVEVPAAALLDPTNQVTEFVTTAEPFLAVEGPANGTTADPLGETSNEITIRKIESDGTSVTVTVDGPEGADLSSWRVAIYDATTAEVANIEFLGDQIELSPRVSEQAKLTFEKIIDTVFLALVATTAGLAIALPLSFIAARNLMKDVSTTVLGLALGLIAVPVGIALGVLYLRLQRSVLGADTPSTLAHISLLALGGIGSYFLGRQIFFGKETVSSLVRTTRAVGGAIAIGFMLEGLFGLLTAIGESLRSAFGIFDFVPGLLATIGEIGTVILPFIIGLIGAAIVLGVASRTAALIVDRTSPALRAGLEYLLMAVAGAFIAALIGAVIDWLYQIADPVKILVVPAGVGALIGLLIARKGRRTGEVKIGLSIYYIARTIFNTLRSIEPLVMVIVFVVWVGFGEFAGSIALAVHTAAALAKLYSEQVESISEGPLEAVRATGASRLQSTVYAVIPQIVPPYIAFTMYRWDINVRMSTILGFAGGGGIGFLLNQNVQLGQYRAAAVQMLAIAIVVASMDYLSSRLRQRFT